MDQWESFSAFGDIAELEQWAINNGFLKFDSKTGKVSEVDFEDVLSYEEFAENE